MIDEERKSSGMVQNINDTIMAFMFGKLKKRQMLAILDEISKAYNGR